MSGWGKIFRKPTSPPPKPIPPFSRMFLDPLPLGTVLHYPHPTGETAHRWALVVGEPDLNIYPLLMVGFGAPHGIAATRLAIDDAWHPETGCLSRHTTSDFAWDGPFYPQ